MECINFQKNINCKLKNVEIINKLMIQNIVKLVSLKFIKYLKKKNNINFQKYFLNKDKNKE